MLRALRVSNVKPAGEQGLDGLSGLAGGGGTDQSRCGHPWGAHQEPPPSLLTKRVHQAKQAGSPGGAKAAWAQAEAAPAKAKGQALLTRRGP